MNDDMSDLAPALLMTVIVAIGIVAFEFRSVCLASPAMQAVAKVEKSKSDKAPSQLAMNDRPLLDPLIRAGVISTSCRICYARDRTTGIDVR